MLSDFIKEHIRSQASYVEYGYGQLEPNHLSAKYTGQIYAQLPADASITVLEQGQFVKYDVGEGLVNFSETGGEWMLVNNEIKLYRDHQEDCEFAMIKDNYQARLYSPYDPATQKFGQSRYYNGVDSEGHDSIQIGDNTFKFDDVTAAPDPYELHYTEDPFHIVGSYKPAKMPTGTTMVPRVMKTNIGDIITTNTIKGTPEEIEKGTLLTPGATGILEPVEEDAMAGKMVWKVGKVYTMPDGQRGVKIVRIA